jgi:transposase
MVLYDTATRAQALTLKLAGFSAEQVQQITGIHPRTVLNILDRAVERGLDLTKPVILDIYI